MQRLIALAFALPSLATSACAIGRTSRASGAESAQGPSAVTVTGSPVVPRIEPDIDEARPEKAKLGATWVRGYWHWDGVHYVWERGRWQDSPTGK